MTDPLPILGTLGGALIGFGGSWLVERSRRGEERATRWLAERQRLYASVIRTMDDYSTSVFRWERIRRLEIDQGRTSPSLADVPSDAEVREALSNAELLVGPRTEVALLCLQIAIHELSDLLHPYPEDLPSPETVKKAYDESFERRHGFKEAARRELLSYRRPRHSLGPVRKRLRSVRERAADLWSRL